MEIGPGTTFAGRYRYEHDLGAGGMGRVVVATHLGLRKRVALKVLVRTRSPEAVRRFLREARLAARITSPHVTQVLDAGQLEDGIPYIAMELLEGIDLARLSKERGALPVAEACDYVLQACAGVGEAHAIGMVHRDVKLANLFLVATPRGALVKVLDFGCAKAERVGASSVANPTEDGAWLGTPRSMAPEQLVSSRDVDARADVWALGVALYTLIAGRPPFDGKLLRVLYDQIQNQPPPPIARPLPPGLAAVIDRCLRKRPEERFADARELAVALAPFAKQPHTSRARYLAIAAVALASTGIGATGVVMAAHRPSRPASAMTTSSATTTISASATPSETASVSAIPPSASVIESAIRPSVTTASAARTATTSATATVSAAASSVSPLYELSRSIHRGVGEGVKGDEARTVAARFCAKPHVRECIQAPDCVAEVADHITLCSTFSDSLGCLAPMFHGTTASKQKVCAGFDIY